MSSSRRTVRFKGLRPDSSRRWTSARVAMAAFADNMEALKHNFLLRGFFNDRGYFNLASISPADYRQGALTRNGARRSVRIWLRESILFEPDPEVPGAERLSEEGKRRLDSAMATFVDQMPAAALIVEGLRTARLEGRTASTLAGTCLARARLPHRQVPARSAHDDCDAAWQRFRREPGWRTLEWCGARSLSGAHDRLGKATVGSRHAAELSVWKPNVPRTRSRANPAAHVG